jgi:FO synthase subunit 1
MDKNIITYSRSMTVNLAKESFPFLNYCDTPANNMNDVQYELSVPYSSIKICNKAKKLGAKEIRFIAGDRPDKHAAVRARLDLWGFSSYVEYIFTICELVFLEGMLPTVDIGYVTPNEMAIIRRIVASVDASVYSFDEKVLEKYFPANYKESRVEIIKSAGKGKVPVTTGIVVGMGETQKSRKDFFEQIAAIHGEYGHIQNVVLQNFIPVKGTEYEKLPAVKKTVMLETVEMARKILPEDIAVTVPFVLNKEINSFINAGVTDLGNINVIEEKEKNLTYTADLKKLEKQLKKTGHGLQRRLPIFSKYIVENWYSRKLAQILDKYKSLLKQVEDEECEDVVKKKSLKSKKTVKKKDIVKKK